MRIESDVTQMCSATMIKVVAVVVCGVSEDRSYLPTFYLFHCMLATSSLFLRGGGAERSVF